MNDPSQAPKVVNEKPDRDGRLSKIVLDGKRPITKAGDPTKRIARERRRWEYGDESPNRLEYSYCFAVSSRHGHRLQCDRRPPMRTDHLEKDTPDTEHVTVGVLQQVLSEALAPVF